MSDLTDQFSKAAIDVKKLNFLPGNETLLFLYGYYKQATIGDCNTNTPFFWDVKATAKYNAWNSLKGLSKFTAMNLYITKVNQLINNASDKK